MKKQWKAERPIGLSAGVKAVEKVCETADIYKAIQQKPPHFILNIEDADSQHIFTKFVAEMYRETGVMDFFEMDDFLEFTLDGTYSQLEDVFVELKGHAVYSNDYRGVVAMDISKLAEHLNEVQVTYFFDYVKKASKYAVFLFYIPVKGMRKRNGASLVAKVVSEITNVKYIEVVPYNVEEFTEMILQMLEDADIYMKTEQKEIITEMIQKKIQARQISTIGASRELGRQLMLHAEMSGSELYLDRKKVSEVCGEQTSDKENKYAKR